MTVTLETLELTDEQYRTTKDAVRRMAHAKWVEAGRPENDKADYWLQAEREWIERCYVPDRSVSRRRTHWQPARLSTTDRIDANDALCDVETRVKQLAR